MHRARRTLLAIALRQRSPGSLHSTDWPLTGCGAMLCVPVEPGRALPSCVGCSFSRKLSSRSRTPQGDEHDPVKTRIVHGMVLGSFAVSAYTVLPFLGGTIIENSAKLLSSRDPLMQRAGADRLRVLAVNSQSCRNHILSSSTAIETIVARIEACSKPDVLENVLLVIQELLQEKGGRRALSANSSLMRRLEELHRWGSEVPFVAEYARIFTLVDMILVEMQSP